MTNNDILNALFSLRDEGYREFQSGLIPNIDRGTVIGVRTPELRKFASELLHGDPAAAECFLRRLPHDYFEENNLHGMLVSSLADYDRVVRELDAFLPFVDNWATCDLIRPKAFKNNLGALEGQIRVWLGSRHVYVVRFAIETLMCRFLDAGFSPEYNELAASVRSEEYYVNMMTAWYFATALAKHYSETVVYLEERRLDRATHNMTIRKAIESFRIPDERKCYLKTLKI